MWTFIKETIFAILIPTPFFRDITIDYYYKEPNFQYLIQYSLNDFMTIATITRFVYSLIYLDKLFEYNSNASYRIIKLLGNNINFSFFIRCLFAEKALPTVFLFLQGTTFYFTLIIRILEWDNFKVDYSDIFSSLWFTYITMVTVGYGDFVPITTYGRIFSFIICLAGVMNIYLVTVILSDKLKLK